MNAQQRRKTYRKIERMIGKRMIFISSRGRAVEVTVTGTVDGSHPSVHRVHCRRNDRTDVSTFSPRVRQLHAAAGAA